MDTQDEDLRLAVYATFAAGRVPDLGALGPWTDEVRAGLRRLAAARHIVLGPETTRSSWRTPSRRCRSASP